MNLSTGTGIPLEHLAHMGRCFIAYSTPLLQKLKKHAAECDRGAERDLTRDCSCGKLSDKHS